LNGPLPFIQTLPGGSQGLQEQGAHLRLEPALQDHRAVWGVIHVQGSLRVAELRLPGLGPSIHAPPASDDAFDMSSGACAAHGEQPRLRLRRRHAGQRADLGVGQLPAGQGLGQKGQRPESTGYTHPLPGRPRIQAHAPGEPFGARAEARVPSAAGVEGADQLEQARGGGVEVRGQLGDLVAEAVEVGG